MVVTGWMLALLAQQATPPPSEPVDPLAPTPDTTIIPPPLDLPAPSIEIPAPVPVPVPTPAPAPVVAPPTVTTPVQPQVTAPTPRPISPPVRRIVTYQPTGTADEYVAPEQGATAFSRWLERDPAANARFTAFEYYLTYYGVGNVVPLWQLTRTASAWRKCGAPPLEVPPDYSWPAMVRTLEYVRDKVIPAVGEVEAVSVYRNPLLNSCAGGSTRSSHRNGIAIDMVPRWPFRRDELMSRLCYAHAEGGRAAQAGFGFYVGLRFHIDTAGYRVWGLDPVTGGAQCARAIALREAARNSTNDIDVID